jgi:hypothetical protein
MRNNCLHKLKSRARKSERKDGTPRTTIHSARTVNPHMREYRGADEPRFTANNDGRHDHNCSAYGRAKRRNRVANITGPSRQRRLIEEAGQTEPHSSTWAHNVANSIALCRAAGTIATHESTITAPPPTLHHGVSHVECSPSDHRAASIYHLTRRLVPAASRGFKGRTV